MCQKRNNFALKNLCCAKNLNKTKNNKLVVKQLQVTIENLMVFNENNFEFC